MTITAKLLLLLAALLPVLAQTKQTGKPNPIDAAYDKCTDTAANQTTAGLSQCSTAAYGAWDKELNAVYRKLLAALDGDGKQSLQAVQVAWIKFRDSETRLYSSMHAQLQGTMYITIFADRNVSLVKQRVLELKGLLEIITGQ